ncbi:MAG: hypothetical protein PHD95_01830 [Candidatus ainarchaeum sp.]|nr:hypothetical protein [Candidatus ainarchaeum sp.]
MNFQKIFVLFSFSILFLLLGCTQSSDSPLPEQQIALKECKQLCNASLPKSDIDWPSGPCLGNPMQQNPDWVCDIAQNPRIALDDIAGNQCSAFPSPTNHFVELDSQCNLIKFY